MIGLTTECGDDGILIPVETLAIPVTTFHLLALDASSRTKMGCFFFRQHPVSGCAHGDDRHDVVKSFEVSGVPCATASARVVICYASRANEWYLFFVTDRHCYHLR